jgi:hypothetical protein
VGDGAGSVAAATAWPLKPMGRAVVLVQLTVDGLKATFAATVNTTGVLVPPDVLTTRLPVAAPAGTVVTIRELVQSPALAMSAVSGPPVPFVKSTCPDAAAWPLPKFDP